MFRAHEPGGGRLVAIKVFRLDITPEQSTSLVRELEQLIARRISHRAVAAPIAAGIDGPAAYLVMDYVVGDVLDVSARDTGPMPLASVVQIVDGVASAIDACADRGVHHGLLHPRDVLLSGDGPRVTGFGIAEALTRIGLRLPARRPYAAPEGASDVYSLAAIAYELIAGRRMTPTGWDELSAEDGPELRNAFAAALSPDPQARPGRAGEFAATLRAAGGSRTTRPAHPHQGRVLVDLAPAAERTTVLDDFADPGAASDLPLDFAGETGSELHAPQEAPLALPSSRGAPPPRAVLVILALIALVVAGVAAYLVSARRVAPPVASQTTPAKPPVAATTVDLSPALPAPSPSRPASGVTSAPLARAPAVLGRLLIRSTPADATVIVNGQPRGRTPLTLRDLTFGSYTIHLTRNGFTSTDRSVQLTARRPSQSIEMSLKLAPAGTAVAPGGAGGMSVESRPSGARVFVNDRLVGSTPLTIPGLPAGPATVRIDKDGYEAWITTVRVNAGEQTHVGASLDRK